MNFIKLRLIIGYYCQKYKIFNEALLLIKRIITDPITNYKLKNLRKQDGNKLIKRRDEERDNFLIKVKKIKENDIVIFPLIDGGAGDIAFRFIYLKEIFYYLNKKKCKIYLIFQENFEDIINLISMYFDVELIKIKKDKYGIKKIYENEKVCKLLNNGAFLMSNEFPLFKGELFLKFGNEKYNVYGCVKDLEEFFNVKLNNGKNVLEKKYKYKFNNINEKKLPQRQIILCNFESKSLNYATRDKIKFVDYYNKIKEIGTIDQNYFVINSVYNKERNSEEDNISVKKLSFQDIIYLAENNLIKQFISERNGLNDVLFVFYPKICQLVYYPEGCGILAKQPKIKNYDISIFNLRKLPQRNDIKQYYRKDFFKTIDGCIEKG